MPAIVRVAVRMTRSNWPGVTCWKYDWVIDLDIKGFFDKLDHDLLTHPVSKHTEVVGTDVRSTVA